MEADFTAAMIGLYHRTGKATGYWANYFLRDVRQHGGLAVAKKLLRPQRGLSKGFDKLVAARRADLSVEALLLEDRFVGMFSSQEIAEAVRRLGELAANAFPSARDVESLHADELGPGPDYFEGAVREVRINAHERNRRARIACLRYHGRRCFACDFDFHERYGLGDRFIHVHHRHPMFLAVGRRQINPIKDLVPICPNCHAVLHSVDPPLDPEDLRERIRQRDRATNSEP